MSGAGAVGTVVAGRFRLLGDTRPVLVRGPRLAALVHQGDAAHERAARQSAAPLAFVPAR